MASATTGGVSDRHPLPDGVTLTRHEAAGVLFALDAAMEALGSGDAFDRGSGPRCWSSRSSSRTSRPVTEAYPCDVPESALRVPEVARRLGIDGAEVYRLISDGELAAGKGADGLVYVIEEALAELAASTTR